MSVLNVENVSHGFGARTILEDASFRLLKGEHVGLIGANGEGKSTFLNIITGQLQPDQGKVTWSNRVTVGYLDQHAVLQKGSSIRDVLRTAFDEMYKLEAEMIGIYDKMGEATPEELDKIEMYEKIAEAFKEAALELDVKILWGGQWKKLRDGPHFQLEE